MDLWSGPLTDFVEHASRKTLASDMGARFRRHHGQQPGQSELNSWDVSLAHLADTLRSLRPYGVGVSLTAPLSAEASLPTGPALALEYHLPISLRRIDVVLTGRDRSRVPTAVVLELKQWNQVDLEDEHATNVRTGGEEHLHPSEQALDYAAWLQDYHSAFADDGLVALPAAYCHGLKITRDTALRDPRFRELLQRSPVFGKGEESELKDFIGERVGGGDGVELLSRLQCGHYRPSKKVMERLEAVIKGEDRWHLLDEQRRAYNAIVAEVERCRSLSGRSVILVRGAPGTGKTVIAVQLLSTALKKGWVAAHSTGGKAFTTVMRSKFKGADGLFIWNLHTRKADYQAMDLLLVDEAHRVRKTSDMRWTAAADRSTRSQTRELMDAAKVSVFLLDENQFMRPDEVGKSKLVEDEASDCGARFKTFDLTSQFRCGGTTEYIDWVDRLLGFTSEPGKAWGDRFHIEVVDGPSQLDGMLEDTRAANDAGARRPETARIVAGFCWTWSDAPKTGPLVRDVVIGDWARAWNRKPNDKTYKPATHPYTLWAETDEGLNQIGCIYSVQGFEFDRVGVIWGPDLVWRSGEWVAQKSASYDKAVKGSKDMLVLVRNAYRVLLTRGMKQVKLLVLDEETRLHIQEQLAAMQG